MADTGHGTTISFGTSGFSADVISYDFGELSRESVETTHMGTSTWKTYTPSDLADAGDMTFHFAFDPDDQPPLTSAAETITITFPVPAGDSSGATFACSGFITSWTPGSITSEGRMESDATIKWTGSPTWTDAS